MMKPGLILAVTLGWLLPAIQMSVQGADIDREEQLIAVLQSHQSAQDKDQACAGLQRIGGTRSVPALEVLLTDEQLSDSARFVLESMPAPAAGHALTKALSRTNGALKVGIINSLGVRGEKEAVPALVKLIADADTGIAVASARALGRIAGPESGKSLQAALGKTTEPVHFAVADACLHYADQLLAAGQRAAALTIYQHIADTEKADAIRGPAFLGLLRAAADQSALNLMVTAISGARGSDQVAALQMVRVTRAPGATKTFTELLPKLTAPVQVALIENLGQRGDAAALPGIRGLVKSDAAEVRLAAINAMGLLGDGAVVVVLAEIATSAIAVERNAARQALVRLAASDTTAVLLAQLTIATPELQMELARALGERGDRMAMPKLMTMAQQESSPSRKAALLALSKLAGQSNLTAMMQLVSNAETAETRSEAGQVLAMTYRHLLSLHGKANAEPLARELTAGSVETRATLFPVCAGLSDPLIRTALRSGIKDANPQVQAAAVRALCETVDAELLPEVKELACESSNAAFRTLAIGGCVRLTTQEGTLSNAQRTEFLKSIYTTGLKADEKRIVLTGLAMIPDLEALRLAEQAMTDTNVQTEAMRAVVKIAPRLTNTKAAITALKEVVSKTSDDILRKEAQMILQQVQLSASYLIAWQAAGPYRKAGADCSALFDIAFPPENDQGAEVVNWVPLPAATDPARPWLMDVLKVFSGDNCVAYARSYIHSEQEQAVRLVVGSDDGVKVWLNNKLVLSNNVIRGLTPGSDQVDVGLHQGWNQMLVKITQSVLGWELCAQLLKPDGSYLEGLEFNVAPSIPK